MLTKFSAALLLALPDVAGAIVYGSGTITLQPLDPMPTRSSLSSPRGLWERVSRTR